jgi:hypothetical protein
MRWRAPRRLLTAALVVPCVLVTCTAFAASLGVTSKKLTTWHSAASITCTAGSVTASASADTYVDQLLLATSHENDPVMKVRAQKSVVGLLGNARSLVKFSLPTIPDLCAVTGATLRLNATAADAGRTLQAYLPDGAWAENVLWGGAPNPLLTGPVATVPSGTGYLEWNVKLHVDAMYVGPNNGFLIKDSNENPAILTSFEQQFSTRLVANPPQLVITYG